jgi:hypothetical protein
MMMMFCMMMVFYDDDDFYDVCKDGTITCNSSEYKNCHICMEVCNTCPDALNDNFCTPEMLGTVTYAGSL